MRYRDWQVSGKSVRQVQTEAAGPLPWWNLAWQKRISLTLSEPGIADRDATLTKVRLDFAGHARVLGATTDVVVVAADGRVVPSRVAPRTRDGERIREAEVAFPVCVDWMMAARYDVYFDNPKAAGMKEKDLSMTTLSLTKLPGNELPSDWKFIGGKWGRKALIRPEPNSSRSPAVKSEHHVAFPGICKTKSGALVVVYREGYSHASGKPDDGRVMLVRSTDQGKTWSEPVVIQDDPGADDRNAAIECMSDGTLCVIWDKYGKGRYPTYGHHWAWMRTSTDEGRTWSEPMEISKDEDVHTRSRPLDLGNGKWLIPYSESTGRKTASSYFAIYDPKTRTFDEIAATPFGQRNIADETAVTRAPNGDLVALIRSNVDPALWQIVSKDDGRTWSEAKLTDIPSQFTPCDLITLSNGWLLCSFSFRERRNERLCVSRDNGKTWDVENSVDVFDGTPNIGGDRSYHASVQIDDETIGSVLYETQTPPTGGHIWFVTTPLAAFSAPKANVLYQGDRQTDAAFALWTGSVTGETVEFSYRFTGLFGPVPNAVGLLLSYDDPQNYTSFEYQMGAAPNRKGSPYNSCHLAQCVAGEAKRSHTMTAQGDWYDDGNIHRLGARHSNGQWTFTIDGVDQFAVPESTGTPCGIIVRRAAVAVYYIDFCDRAVQKDAASLDIQAGQIEERKPD